MAWPVSPLRVEVGALITRDHFNAVADAVDRLREPQPEPPTAAALVATAMVAAGTSRKVTRRGLLGLGLFRSTR